MSSLGSFDLKQYCSKTCFLIGWLRGGHSHRPSQAHAC